MTSQRSHSRLLWLVHSKVLGGLCFFAIAGGETRLSTRPLQLLEPHRINQLYMGLQMFGCCGSESGSSGRRSYQERKLRMLTHWRDAAERQVSALNAAITTLQQQMERDAATAAER